MVKKLAGQSEFSGQVLPGRSSRRPDIRPESFKFNITDIRI